MKRFLTMLFICLTVTCSFAEEIPYVMSLEAVSRLALENNFDIQLAQYDAWIAQTGEDQVKSIYDTIFTGEVRYRDNQREQSSTIFGTKTQENDYIIGLSKKLPTGTEIRTTLTNEREFTNSSFTTSPLTHDSTLEFRLEQDLGRNFFGLQDRGRVKLKLVDIENSEYTTLNKLETTLADVQKAYWDLVYQWEVVQIEEDMAAQAQTLYTLHLEKSEDGYVEVPDLVASEVNVRRRQNQLTLARSSLQSKNAQLLLMLNQTYNHFQIQPSDRLQDLPSVPTFEHALKKAFASRRDYKIVANTISAKEISLSMKKNNLWPELDLIVSLANNGLGDHFSDSVKTITDESNPNYFLGLMVTFPIENRQARAELKQADLEKAKMLLQLKYLERQISVAIQDQVRVARVLNEVAANTDTIARLEKKKLDEELKRYARGRSDTDTVIRYQADANEALLRAAEAKLNYYTALIDLRVEEASLLKDHWDSAL